MLRHDQQSHLTEQQQPLIAEPFDSRRAAEQNVPLALPYAVAVTSSAPRGDWGKYTYAPRRIVCQSCGYEVVTSVDRASGPGTHLVAGIMCILGLWPCCLIPYCVNGKLIKTICFVFEAVCTLD